ncbi:DUF3644 domain-containing protein [Acetobacter pasteurianus]|uniref:DUF3644 domain-containing protein n=1 Tax=Acetobacter pasteurianus NBRC 3188 TaxID=1226663 RepID=A0A401WQ08_ACEPA|nr:DUF3644 domain-containing protein [Acetobacter pasteurianus]GCD51400.1 hypothetical protein NBRC3188_0097 [Acetobacter pasteurianus NBRC 3188]
MAGKTGGSLTDEEKHIVKALLNRGMTGQDILNLLNIGRCTPINGGRISSVKHSGITPASDDVVELFLYKQQSYDLQTGLNLVDDERIIKAREAMFLAVDLFNTPYIRFKAEGFSVYAIIAWTYLVHEFCKRKGIRFEDKNGKTDTLGHLIKKRELALSDGIKKNLDAMKDIRDSVEHRITGSSDPKWYSIFQACCLNFDAMLVKWFGEKVSLKKNLSFALQFARLSIPQIAEIQNFNIPPAIEALDARLNRNLLPEEENNIEYRLKVVYTLDSVGKSNANVRFVNPASPEGEEIHNVLVRDRPTDDLYPYKAKRVVEAVKQDVSIRFNMYSHTKAWKHYKIRPQDGSKCPEKTDKRYCIYHKAHNDYTYNRAWIDFLIDEIQKGRIK